MGPTTGLTTRPATAARWAGLGYLALFLLAIFANFLAVGAVLDPESPRSTFADLTASETTFRFGAAAFLAVFLIDIVVAWALYVLFRGLHRDLSLLAAWSRLVYTVFLGVALVYLFQALELVRIGGDDRGRLEGDVLLALQSFDMTWVIGLAAFGVHLVLLGRLLLATPGAPRWLGWVVVVAGVAYVVDTVAHLVLADYPAYADVFLAVVAVPSVVGEFGVTVWLLLVAAGRRPVPAVSAGSEHEGRLEGHALRG
ncbi:DUF4386 domain-containing protein [Nocardioides donggukensis]|uniref:DUF4386 domain-containing protein n=1 Tax=Nocardioides donggukensis TaxID=2774019 RepID=A0A927K715_9ACTN|nr:DUF4386 domain-containing protein [Nocardioides donggukensis]MBD8870188.1 DUF4386 domain-containing protein [Nocardioides donggukensis]